MTADSDLNPVVGPCLYNCSSNLIHALRYSVYRTIKSNATSNINRETCGAHKRKGFMCGQCIKNYGFPAYSYDIACVECLDYKYNWLKYIAMAYLPLTIFYLVIIIFRISANSGLLVGYVTVSQMVVTYSLIQAYLAVDSKNENYHLLVKMLTIFSAIWNLDFFRIMYPSFCLHPNMSALGVLSLDYLVAIYPMAAVLITYLVVQKLSYVTCLCRPLYKCRHLIKKEWNFGNSLIEAFATLLLLSNVKILNVTFNILKPTHLYYMNGTYHHPHVYNDPNTVYMSRQHLPFVILAFTMSFVFNFLPILLACLYTFKCSQKCLNRTGLQLQTLSTFMDAFQGSYKHKPYYLRSFPAIYSIGQFNNLLIFSCFGFKEYYSVASLNLMLIIILVAIARPYKNKWHNVITLSLFGAVFTAYICLVFQLDVNSAEIQHSWRYVLVSLSYCGAFVPLLYGLIIFLRGVIPARIIMKAKRALDKNKSAQNDTLPYRLECDEENTWLLSNNHKIN